ncbi:hypothetical protein PGT21_004839 [Puccinia graminis f. sp. tritici]|uniref:Uncharacterized protein n=1 Tax=Puccinia graminis f. sp. tritici TaxID=56615 RepID=A0A5B0LP75_PUCGR|nr:hypothetical protein PGT21_004839 [Puccinia graminis f. sp. tritici]KAA1080022.1 hypothetical protein PGTUg99_022461 [Puccinia graminis f. sp. tritici]
MHVFGIALVCLAVVCRFTTAFGCYPNRPQQVCRVQLGELVWYVRADYNTVKIDQEPLHFSVTAGTECVDTTGHVVGKACCPANAIPVKSYINGPHFKELGCGAYK